MSSAALERRPFVSVVVPAYQEEERIGDCLERLTGWLADGRFDYEVVVVDDGSTDRTAATVRSWVEQDRRIRLESYSPNRGKGFAVRRGLAAARGEYRFFTDADLSTPPEEIGRGLELLADHDLVIGTRARESSLVIESQRWHRQRMGRTFNHIIRFLGLTRVPDTQCGFKGFRAEILPALLEPLSIDGFSFDVELMCEAECQNLRVAELPVTWINSPISRVRLTTDSIRMLLEVVAIAWRYRGRTRRRATARNRHPT